MKLGEALLVAGVNAVNEPPAHQHLRAVLDKASLQLFHANKRTNKSRAAGGMDGGYDIRIPRGTVLLL